MSESRLSTVLRHLHQVRVAGCADLTDGQLLRRFLGNREESAFAALMERHGRLVLNVCQQVLRHQQDAEDAFQATFLVLARKADSVRKHESLASWLYGVAYRVSLKARMRAADRRQRDRSIEPVKPHEASPVADASLRELQSILADEVRCLPEKYREPFVLCCLEGLSKSEAARHLGWKEGTVSGRLAQARQMLRSRLARRGVALSAGLIVLSLAGATTSAALPALARITLASVLGNRLVSSSVQLLAEEVVRSMFIHKLKSLTPILLTIAACATVSGWLAEGVLARAPQELPANAEAFAGPEALGLPGEAPADDAKRESQPALPKARVDALPPGALVRLGTLRLRHNNMVTSVAWAPDGKLIASASGGAEKLVVLWDPLTGKEQTRLRSHTGTIYGMAFSPDGKWMASCSEDKTVSLWETAATGRTEIKPRQILEEKGGAIFTLAFLPDSKSLVTGSNAGGVAVWDVATGKEQARYGVDLGRALRIALAPDGKTLAVAHLKGDFGKVVGKIILWDLATGKEIRQIGPDQKEVYSLAFSADGATLASGGESGPRLWEVASGDMLVKLHNGAISSYTPSVAFTPDGKSLIAGGSNFLAEWSLATGQVGRSYPVGASYTYSIAFSPDGKSMVTGGTRTVGLWDLATAKPKFAFGGHQGEVSALVFSQNGKELITGGYDKPIYRWDLATGKEVGRFTGPNNWTHLLIPSPDGKKLLTQGDNLALIVLDAATVKELARFVKHLPPRTSGHTTMGAVFTPDGKSVISYAQGIDPNIRIWETDTGKEILVIPASVGKPQGDNLTGIAVSPDGKTLYTANRLGAARVWDTATGKELRQIAIKENNTRPLTFSSDGRYLAGILGNAIAVWDTTTGKEIRNIPCPRGFPTSMRFSPDGRTLAVTNAQEPVRLCEIATGQSRLEVSGHAGPVKGFTFSADGRLFATGSDDTTALIWDLRALSLAGIANRTELTPKTLDTLWTDLSGDSPVAYKALARLSGFPKETVAFLGSRLSPVEGKQLDKLIAKLDDDDFDTRESSTKELSALGMAAEPAMRKALASAPSAEARVRLENLLGQLEKGAEGNKNRLGLLRALEVLETIGTAEAQKLVQGLAKGAELAELTVEARATLTRMEGKARHEGER